MVTYYNINPIGFHPPDPVGYRFGLDSIMAWHSMENLLNYLDCNYLKILPKVFFIEVEGNIVFNIDSYYNLSNAIVTKHLK